MNSTDDSKAERVIDVALTALEAQVVLEAVMNLPLALADARQAAAVRVVNRIKALGRSTWAIPAPGGTGGG